MIGRSILKRKLMEGRTRKRRKLMDDIIHPQQTDKEFRSIQLRNGLSAILISDNRLTQSAAALTVRFGSFSDPPEMQGIAHLIEHMVFVGSKEFPGDNELRDFLSKHGGEVNAQTEMEFTTFYMGVVAEHLEGALKRFAHLFINPLMKVERVEKEINTIDSEFLLHKCKDSCRLEQLIGHTSPIKHPYNRFAWGNKRSLGSQSAQSLRDKAMELFNDCYVAHSMKLVVMGEESLDVLENWVNEFFSPVRRGNLCLPVLQPTADKIWNSDIMYVLQSVENAQKLYITWLLPPLSKASRPENCLVQLLSDESEGSLCSFLKEKGWISSLNVYVGSEMSFTTCGECSYKCTSAGCFFTVCLDITNNGLEEKYQIVTYLYQYLNLVRDNSPPKWVEEEYSASLRLQFDHLDADDCFINDPSMFVQRLSGNMLKCPASHVLCLDFLNGFGGTDEIQKILKHFNPQNMRIDLLKPKPLTEENEDLKTEPWFDATYIEERIPSSLIATLESSKLVDSSLKLPRRNEYTVFDFSVRELEESEEEVQLYELNGSEEEEEAHESEEEQEVQFYELHESEEEQEVQFYELHESEEEEEVQLYELHESEEELEAHETEEQEAHEFEEEEVNESDEDTVVESFEVVEEDSKTFIYKKQEGMSYAFLCLSLNVQDSIEDHMKTMLFTELVKDEISPIVFKGTEACIYTSLSLRDDNKLRFASTDIERSFRYLLQISGT